MKSVIVAAKFKQSFSPGIKVTADFPRGKILHQKNIILTFSSILGGLGGTSIDIQLMSSGARFQFITPL